MNLLSVDCIVIHLIVEDKVILEVKSVNAEECHAKSPGRQEHECGLGIRDLIGSSESLQLWRQA